MVDTYKEASCKLVDGEFHGRIYEFANGNTLRHDIYKDAETFKKALEETEWARETF